MGCSVAYAWVLCAVSAASGLLAGQQDLDPAFRSTIAPDRAPEVRVPAFLVREVTGRRPDAATCLVCRYGDRPVVMVCARRYSDAVAKLLARVDRMVDEHRAHGLKGFALFTAHDDSALSSELFTAAYRNHLAMPLAISVELGGPAQLELPDDDRITVLVYARRLVVGRFEGEEAGLTPAALDALAAELEQLALRK